MSFLLPSYFQKRILRYALTRLELLDTDDLDLEKLDITWGRKSTIELRDIGINIDKVSALLKLPQAFLITNARITTLRVTVPADLYQSNIVLEADGVKFTVRADSASEEDLAKEKNRSSWQESDKTSTLATDKANDPAIGSGIGQSGEDEDSYLPTSLDLAQSFMQSEPVEERSELQAVVASSLQTSQSFSSKGSDLGASEVGMGNEISLPGFLAAYLKGVGDRIKVNLENIAVDLVLRLPNKAELNSIEDVKIRISMDQIAVGEVSGDFGKKQMRRVKLKNIQLFIISEQSLFSNLAKSTNLSSPETAYASVILKAENKPGGPSPALAEDSASTEIGDYHEHHSSDRKVSQPSIFTTKTSITSQSDRIKTNDADLSVERANLEEGLPGSSILSDSFHSVEEHSIISSSKKKRPRPPRPSISSEKDDGMAPRQTLPTSRATVKSRGYTESPSNIFNDYSPPNSPKLQGRTDATRVSLSANSRGTSGISMEDFRTSSPRISNPTTARSSSSSESLAESKIFSHDQRESMYMSVLSDVPPDVEDGEGHVPGAWESSCINDDPSITAQLERLKSEATSESNRKTQKPSISQLNNEGLVENYESDRLGISANLLGSDELPQQGPVALAKPILGIDSPIFDDRETSPRCSASLPDSHRDSTVLAKRVLSIDSVTLELPCNPKTASRIIATADSFVPAETMPITQRAYGPKLSWDLPQNSEKGQATTQATKGNAPQRVTTIAIENVQLVGDVGLTKLIVLVTEKLSTMSQSLELGRSKSAPSRPHMSLGYVLTVNAISWKFVDLVNAISVPDKTSQGKIPPDAISYQDSDVLLASYMTHLHLDRVQSKDHSRTKISIGKFIIGYADANIMSFSTGAKLRASIQDDSMPLDNDLKIEIVETKDNLSIDIKSLPMHVVLDLRRLDETFSWFGGFSSMLGLGSSMISTVTLLDPNSRTAPLRKVSRVVHFESSPPEPIQLQRETIRSTKITARIGGLVFDLQGTNSGLRIESTAIKIVSRPEGLGMQIDRLKLHGPVIDDSGRPPILAKLANTRIEYLTAPKENDLTRLLLLLAPSKDTYGDEDDILVDTLLRQRRKGNVLRISIETLDLHLLDTPALQCFPVLIDEAKKLSTVAKYLPEDDRPGVLTLLLVKSINAEAHLNDNFGVITLKARKAEVANITFPSLSALGISDLQVHRNTTEDLVGEALRTNTDPSYLESHPMIMARYLGNEMEPTVKIKFYNTRFEYHVTTVMSLMDLRAELAARDLMSDMISSVVELTGRPKTGPISPRLSSEQLMKNDGSLTGSARLKFDVAFREVVLGLNPLDSSAKGLVVFTDAHFMGSMPNEAQVHSTFEIRKAELMIVDDVKEVLDPSDLNARKNVDTLYTQIQALSETGYVSISQISAMKIILHVNESRQNLGAVVDAEISDYLFVLESCADSTQTALKLFKDLKPPTPKSTALKYQTEIIPVEDMLASFSGRVFTMEESRRKTKSHGAHDDNDSDSIKDVDSQNLEYVDSFYNPDLEYSVSESLSDSMSDEDVDSVGATSMLDDHGDEKLSENLQEHERSNMNSPSLDIRDDYFDLPSPKGGVIHRWDPKQNMYDVPKDEHCRNPLRVQMRNVHVIWNLFDGFDWQHTRDAISQAVAEVQTKAIERQSALKHKSSEPEDEDEDLIGDFLFNSIYIGIPAKSDPDALARQINHNIDDLVSETGSSTTFKSAGVSPNRAMPIRPKSGQLRLKRSKHHKMTFELKGVSADLVVSPPGSGEIESSLDIRVQDLEIFDHVPTSTWKKFATYMHDAGERESGTSMIHIEIFNVKPVPDLAASEITLKVSLQLSSFIIAKTS